jgi:hypothetical protein
VAEKRMFSQKITRSDAFLAMPTSARLLYYDLSMDADDDGFVDRPKSVMKLTGASDDDLSILIAKSFVIPFENGVCVIKHWRINNYIRGDRYKETNYRELKNQLLTKENGAYTLKMHSGIPSDNQVVTTWERSIDKIRLDKDSINIMVKSNDVDRVQEVQSSSSFAPKKEDEPTNEKSLSKTEKDFNSLWELYPRKIGKKDALKYYQAAVKHGTTFDDVKAGIENYVSYIERNKIEPQFIKHGKTWFYQKGWVDDYSTNYTSGSKPYTKTVKQSPEWLKNYENVKEPEEKALTPEEVEKEMEKLKAKFETKIPEALKGRP